MKPVVTSIFSILFFAFISSAQDEPCSAISLDCNAEAINGNFDGATFNPSILPNGCPGGQSSNTEGDIWFSFEADGEQGYLFYSGFASLSADHFMLLYTGTDCNDLTRIRECQMRKTFHDVFPAGTYYVQVAPQSNSAEDNEFSAGLICGQPPENDSRCNATLIDCGDSFSGSFIGASRDEIVQCACNAFDVGDVWFELEAEAGVTYDIIGKQGQQIQIFEVDTCTDALVQSSLCCLSQNIPSFSGDGKYFINARPAGTGNPSLLNFQLLIECAAPPANDLPCDAIEVVCEGPAILGTTVNAGSNLNTCGGGGTGTAPMVWYKYTSDFEGSMELYLCGVAPTFNATASIYTGSCGDLTCYDAGGGCISGPKAFDVSPGEDYFFAIHGFGGSVDGEFSLTFQCEEDDFCPDLNQFVGDPCSDGQIITDNDVVTADCECVGTPIKAGELCENAIPVLTNPYFDSNSAGDFGFFEPLEYSYNINDIPPFAEEPPFPPSPQCYEQGDLVYSFTSPVDRVLSISVDGAVFGTPNATILKGCPFTTTLWAECANGPITDFYAFADTTYYILIDGDAFSVNSSLENVYELTVTAPKACPELDGKEGDACDDGDPLTENDVITLDCECIGEVPNPIAYCSDPLNITPGPGLTASPIPFDASDAVPSPLGYCDGSNEERADSWFSFEAITSNMAIGVKGVGDYDAVLEVYDACGGNRIKCRNGGEEGERETVLLLNSVIGQEYLYRVYEKGGNFSNFNSFRTSVTFFPSADIEQADCDQGTFTTSDQITATIPEFEYPVSSRTWEFTELEAPFNVYEFVVSNGSNPNIGLDQFPEIEAGRGYSVRVKPSYLNLGIDGDFGEACVISVVDPNGISSLQSEGYLAEPEYTFDMYPNPNDGNEVVVALSDLSNSQNTAIIRIYDFVGRLVMNHQVIGEGQQMTVQLPLVDLANGVYVVKITVNEKPLTAKKLVIR